MNVLSETIRIGGLSMMTIFVSMAGLYMIIKILMKKDRKWI